MARPLLRACASAECPALIQKDCSRWLDEVDAATPTLVLELRGSEVLDAGLVMDGRALRHALDGAGIAVDPGRHHFVIQVKGRPDLEVDIVVFEGEKLRRVRFDVPAPPIPVASGPQAGQGKPPSRDADRVGPPAPKPSPAPRAPFWFATSAAIAGLAAGGILVYVGNVQRGYLADECRSVNGCTEGDKAALHTRLIAADVVLGAALLAGAAAALIYLLDHRAAPAR